MSINEGKTKKDQVMINRGMVRRTFEVKSTFTFNVLIGIQSYSKTKKSNPLQLEKIKWISDNIKPIKIFIVDNNSEIKEVC